jgi:hypothetical protein
MQKSEFCEIARGDLPRNGQPHRGQAVRVAEIPQDQVQAGTKLSHVARAKEDS